MAFKEHSGGELHEMMCGLVSFAAENYLGRKFTDEQVEKLTYYLVDNDDENLSDFILSSVKKALEENAWDGDWYLRAFPV